MDVWYAVYRVDTGQLDSVGTVLADPMPAGLVAKAVGTVEPNNTTQEWDATLLAFVQRPPNEG